jgi:hypothetical protein
MSGRQKTTCAQECNLRPVLGLNTSRNLKLSGLAAAPLDERGRELFSQQQRLQFLDTKRSQ